REPGVLWARAGKAAGRPPAIGAAHDRGRAVFLLHTKKLGSSKIERVLPRYRHEALAAAAGAALGPARQVAFAHHRAHDASLRIHRFGQRLDQRRRIGITLERSHANHASVVDLRLECAEVRVMLDILNCHWVNSLPAGILRYRATSCQAPSEESQARRTSVPAPRAPWAGSAGRA